MAALLAVGTPSLPFGFPGPFCSPTVVYLPASPIYDVPIVSGSLALAVPASPQLAFLGLTVQAVQLRAACLELSNALCIRLQP